MEKLKHFEFQRQGRKSFYNWDEILDGSVWQIGLDDLMNPVSPDASKREIVSALDRFRRTAYAAANGRDLSIQTQMTDKAVVLQATAKE